MWSLKDIFTLLWSPAVSDLIDSISLHCHYMMQYVFKIQQIKLLSKKKKKRLNTEYSTEHYTKLERPLKCWGSDSFLKDGLMGHVFLCTFQLLSQIQLIKHGHHKNTLHIFVRPNRFNRLSTWNRMNWHFPPAFLIKVQWSSGESPVMQ